MYGLRRCTLSALRETLNSTHRRSRVCLVLSSAGCPPAQRRITISLNSARPRLFVPNVRHRGCFAAHILVVHYGRSSCFVREKFKSEVRARKNTCDLSLTFHLATQRSDLGNTSLRVTISHSAKCKPRERLLKTSGRRANLLSNPNMPINC